MKKKSLLLAISAMSIAAIGVGTVGTFAWYSASQATRHDNMVGSGTIAVGQASTGIDDIYFNVAPNSTPATSLFLTNRAGRTYYRSGNAYQEIYGDDNGSTLASPATVTPSAPAVVKKQAGVAWKVWLSTTSGGSTAPSKAALASVAGTYTVKVTASGAVKASTTKTTALVTDNTTPVYNFTAPTGGEASGALGAEALAEITLGTIIIADDGTVKETIHQAAQTSWADVKTAVVDDETIYYGIECTNDEAVANPTENGALTPSVDYPVQP